MKKNAVSANNITSKAISERNIEGIINNVNRKDVPQSRNNWAKDELRKIRRLDY